MARIKLGLARELQLGNLEAKRDWGHARDYVRAMWLMLQQDAAGRLRHRHRPHHAASPISARMAFGHAGLELAGHSCAPTPPCCARPRWTCCWATPARRATRLGWAPAVTLEDMVAEMVEADLARHRARTSVVLPTEASLRAAQA